MQGDKCSYEGCKKIAIGYEMVTRNMALNVCEDHCSKIMLTMKPGEKVGKPGYNNGLFDYHHRYLVEE